MTEPITKAQLSKLHVLLNQLGMTDQKKSMVSNVSCGRTESSRELSKSEARQLIEYLAQYDPCERMRKKVFALAYEAKIIYGHTPEDRKMNTAKIDLFLKEKGTVRKALHEMKHAELVKVVTQFEQIVKHNVYSQATKQTSQLLKDLKIPTHGKQ